VFDILKIVARLLRASEARRRRAELREEYQTAFADELKEKGEEFNDFLVQHHQQPCAAVDNRRMVPHPKNQTD
jgi:hypothetical protein